MGQITVLYSHLQYREVFATDSLTTLYPRLSGVGGKTVEKDQKKFVVLFPERETKTI